MKYYLFLIAETIIGVLIFTLAVLNVFPVEYLQYILIAACAITGLDILNDALVSIINLEFKNLRIYMVIAVVVLIVITVHTHEALLCLIIVQVTGLLSAVISAYFKRYPQKFVNKFLPKEAILYTEECYETVPVNSLNQGDIIVVSTNEIVPLDCILLEENAHFEPASMFSTLKSSILYKGDEVQGGLRLTEYDEVKLKVAVPPTDSIFIRYTNTYLNTVSHYLKYNAIKSSGYYCNAITLSFKKGVLINSPLNIPRLFKAKAAIFTKETLLNLKRYRLTGICPKDNSITRDELLKYAVRAELPYADTHIANAILSVYNEFSFLSDVENTEKFPNLGIKTITSGDVILAGNKQLMISQNVKELPDFAKLEDGMDINTTYIYISVNDHYVGYLHLVAPVRENLADIINFFNKRRIHTVLIIEDNCCIDSIYNITDKKHRFKEIYTNQTAAKKQETLLLLKEKLKIKNDKSIIYIDTTLSDANLTSMCDYNIIIGPARLHQDISLADASILSGNYQDFISTIRLLKKARRESVMHTFIIIFFKCLVLISAICFPEVYIWHAVLADCVMYLLINTYSVGQLFSII